MKFEGKNSISTIHNTYTSDFHNYFQSFLYIERVRSTLLTHLEYDSYINSCMGIWNIRKKNIRDKEKTEKIKTFLVEIISICCKLIVNCTAERVIFL